LIPTVSKEPNMANSEAIVVQIVDLNNFGCVLVQRVFTTEEQAVIWAQLQKASIIEEFRAAGEDLLDIECKLHRFFLDNGRLTTGYKRTI
jgi:hypothetical protein